MGKLVSIAEYGTAAEAHIVKSRLEAEGIPCYLYNENLNSILTGVSFA
ncbi:MAG: putative signal transducing protein, partial [Croceimicrobium sp.]